MVFRVSVSSILILFAAFAPVSFYSTNSQTNAAIRLNPLEALRNWQKGRCASALAEMSSKSEKTILSYLKQFEELTPEALRSLNTTQKLIFRAAYFSVQKRAVLKCVTYGSCNSHEMLAAIREVVIEYHRRFLPLVNIVVTGVAGYGAASAMFPALQEPRYILLAAIPGVLYYVIQRAINVSTVVRDAQIDRATWAQIAPIRLPSFLHLDRTEMAEMRGAVISSTAQSTDFPMVRIAESFIPRAMKTSLESLQSGNLSAAVEAQAAMLVDMLAVHPEMFFFLAGQPVTNARRWNFNLLYFVSHAVRNFYLPAVQQGLLIGRGDLQAEDPQMLLPEFAHEDFSPPTQSVLDIRFRREVIRRFMSIVLKKTPTESWDDVMARIGRIEGIPVSVLEDEIQELHRHISRVLLHLIPPVRHYDRYAPEAALLSYEETDPTDEERAGEEAFSDD